MRKIIIDSMPLQRRTALVQDGRLVEFIYENKNISAAANNIYVGIIKKILPSLFAFVDLGGEKNAFLYLNDKKEEHLWHFDESKNKRILSIKEGQQIAVCVEKEETEIKGAYLTTVLSYSGKYVVLMYNDESIGISKKIENVSVRKRLKSLAKNILPEKYGIIMRTQCENASETEICKEINSLIEISTNVNEKAKYIKAPAVIYNAQTPSEKAIRDFITDEADEIITNDKAFFDMLPLKNKFFYDESLPIFERYGISAQLQKALHNKIWLNCGAFLIFDYAEACTVIDVNTGKCTGKNHNKTVLKANMEAAVEIAYQIRLKNLSGMIIIDFIDMPSEQDRNALLDALSQAIKKDSVPVNLVGMTELGLVQLTRKKTTKPLHQLLLKECPFCSGTGYIENENYIADKIYEKVCSVFSSTVFKEVTVSANQYVINAFKGKNNDYKKIEEKFGKKINFNIIQTQKYDYFKVTGENGLSLRTH